MQWKRGHEFEIQQGGIYGGIWKEEREGENIVNYNHKNKSSKQKKTELKLQENRTEC